jgi:hypothetical protein
MVSARANGVASHTFTHVNSANTMPHTIAHGIAAINASTVQ